MRGLFAHSRRRTGLALAVVLSVFLVTSAGVLGTWAGLWETWADDLQGPSPNDRVVSRYITRAMRSDHLLRHPLDDEISQRAFKNFLDGLDPMKLYFMQSDIDEFGADRDQLDDQLLKRDLQFAYKVFSRFLTRVNERVKWVDEFLAMEHDFTLDEEMVTDKDSVRYARSVAECRDRWRKRIKYDLLVLKGDKTEGEEAIERLTRRYHNFERRMRQFNDAELVEMYLTAITTSYDPHTTYMSQATMDNFRIALSLNLEGIGAQLADEDGYATIKKVIPGGAADRHGKLKEDDQIVSVGQGEAGEMNDVVNMKLNDVVKQIRGEAGTKVRLGVKSPGSPETKIYTITRAKVELNDSAAQGKIFEAGEKPNGQTFKLGVIDLPSFYMDMEAARSGDPNFRSTTRDVRRILDDFNRKNVDAVVLDLRRNGGGSLTEAINLTGLFIDQGPVVQVKGSDDRVMAYDDTDAGMAWEGPLVVMTSKLSASASEILAGAIQDYERGVIVGDSSTHGKGTVQSLMELGNMFGIGQPSLGALKITMQQFYRPNGDSTQRRGVLSDVVLPSITDHMDVAESDLDYAIPFDSVRKGSYFETNMVSPEIVEALREKSIKRRDTNEKFKESLEQIERYVQQKRKKSVTLNEAKYFAERDKFNAEKEDEKQLEEAANNDGIKRDYYLNEVLSITVDYLDALKKAKKVVGVR